MNLSLLHHALANLEVALFLKDAEGRYSVINATGAKMIGQSVASMIGRDDFTLFEKFSAHRIRENDAAILRSFRGTGGLVAYDSWARTPGQNEDMLFHSFKTVIDDGVSRSLLGLSFLSKSNPLDNEESRLLIREMLNSRAPVLMRICSEQLQMFRKDPNSAGLHLPAVQKQSMCSGSLPGNKTYHRGAQ